MSVSHLTHVGIYEELLAQQGTDPTFALWKPHPDKYQLVLGCLGYLARVNWKHTFGFLFVAVFVMLISRKEMLQAVTKSKLQDFTPIVLSGIGYFFYNFFTFKAYTFGGEVGRIDAINNSEVFLIILVEYFLFKNRKGIFRKLFAAALAFGGVLILGKL